MATMFARYLVTMCVATEHQKVTADRHSPLRENASVRPEGPSAASSIQERRLKHLYFTAFGQFVPPNRAFSAAFGRSRPGADRTRQDPIPITDTFSLAV
jgi:hypothetical protein